MKCEIARTSRKEADGLRGSLVYASCGRIVQEAQRSRPSTVPQKSVQGQELTDSIRHMTATGMDFFTLVYCIVPATVCL